MSMSPLPSVSEMLGAARRVGAAGFVTVTLLACFFDHFSIGDGLGVGLIGGLVTATAGGLWYVLGSAARSTVALPTDRRIRWTALVGVTFLALFWLPSGFHTATAPAMLAVIGLSLGWYYVAPLIMRRLTPRPARKRPSSEAPKWHPDHMP